MAQLPIPGGDDGSWGNILNTFLDVSHNSDGTLQTTALQQAGAITGDSTVTVSGTPASGQVLTATGDSTAAWSTLNGGAGPSTLAGDSDVAISGPSSNQVLAYNGTVSKWQNATLTEGDVTNLTSDLASKVVIAGDLGGTAASPTVARVNGITVSGTPAKGQSLMATGSNTAQWSAVPSANRIYVDAYGADPTGATDSTAAFVAAQTAGGSGAYELILGVGNYTLGTSDNLNIFGPSQGMIGQGAAHTAITYIGNSTCVQAFDSTFNDSVIGGRFDGFTLSGYSAGGSAIGMSWGNMQSARSHDIAIYGFDGGGLQLKNGSGWAEESEWTGIRLIQNGGASGANVIFDTGSFDYSVYQFVIVANSGTDGIRLQNGVNLTGCRLELRGNFIAGSGNTGAVVAIDRGNASGTSYIANAQMDISVETADSGTGHYTILMGSSNAASQFYGTGILSFSNVSTNFQGVSNPNYCPLGFSGVINDTVIGNMNDGDGLAVVGGSQWTEAGSLSSINYGSIYFEFGDIQAFQLPSYDVTFNFYGEPDKRARRVDLFIAQPPSGSPGTITWPTNVQWPGNAIPTLSIGNNDVDHIRLVYLPNEESWYGEKVGGNSTGSGPSLVATTGASGVALTNGYQNIVTWTAPNDGNLHTVTLIGDMNVTSTLTGGGVSLQFTTPAGTVTYTNFLNNGVVGDHQSSTQPLLVKAGSEVILYQTSPMTAGAATVYIEIWGS